jgi:hypothetical protein
VRPVTSGARDGDAAPAAPARRASVPWLRGRPACARGAAARRAPGQRADAPGGNGPDSHGRDAGAPGAGPRRAAVAWAGARAPPSGGGRGASSSAPPDPPPAARRTGRDRCAGTPTRPDARRVERGARARRRACRAHLDQQRAGAAVASRRERIAARSAPVARDGRRAPSADVCPPSRRRVGGAHGRPRRVRAPDPSLAAAPPRAPPRGAAVRGATVRRQGVRCRNAHHPGARRRDARRWGARRWGARRPHARRATRVDS